ncbi:MAG: ubiquinone/menaquinone biosynthesis methyltransferase [Spartobacteria bacterium]|nr:ubiquinone/menaquinone biosynthesis methyltransferase [Spartobacteria bacterium]
MKTRHSLGTRQRLGQPDSKRALNREIFTTVAPRYDLITRLLSFARDPAWKRHMIQGLPSLPAPVCLDLACGTGDITRLLADRYPRGRVIGMDFTEAMLDMARQHPVPAPVEYLCRDMAQTGLKDASVDIVTGGYALRNAGDLHAALSEIFRILKPGGWAAFLEFSKPHTRLLQRLEYGLLTFWGGLWGWAFHRNPGIYTYIAESLAHFPDRPELHHILQAHGFSIQRSSLHFFGVAECLIAYKNPKQVQLSVMPVDI